MLESVPESVRLMVETAISTGMRVSDILGLNGDASVSLWGSSRSKSVFIEATPGSRSVNTQNVFSRSDS